MMYSKLAWVAKSEVYRWETLSYCDDIFWVSSSPEEASTTISSYMEAVKHFTGMDVSLDGEELDYDNVTRAVVGKGEAKVLGKCAWAKEAAALARQKRVGKARARRAQKTVPTTVPATTSASLTPVQQSMAAGAAAGRTTGEVPARRTGPLAAGKRRRGGATPALVHAAPASIRVHGVPLQNKPNASYLGQRQGANGQSTLLDMGRQDQAVNAAVRKHMCISLATASLWPPVSTHSTASSSRLRCMGQSCGAQHMCSGRLLTVGSSS